jgi:hypothetical protein
VWTIDLCYLLQKYAIRNKLATTTLGVDKGYHTSVRERQNKSIRRLQNSVDKGYHTSVREGQNKFIYTCRLQNSVDKGYHTSVREGQTNL